MPPIPWNRSLPMTGAGPIRGSGPPIPPGRFGNTRCGPRWGESTVRSETAIWFAVVPQWKRMGEGRAGWSCRTHDQQLKPILPRRPAAMLPHWELWVDETPRPGWANMAIDLALLDRAEQLDECFL